MKLPKNQSGQAPPSSGQALLLVLLSLSVVLTVTLYITSRSITDISISSKDEEALRAFSAAEAGIERALVTGSTGSVSIGDATFNAKVSGFGSEEVEIVYPVSLESGDAATFWFVGHNSDGSLGCSTENCFTGQKLKVCWGNEDTGATTETTPALEVSVFYLTTPGDYFTARIARVALDPYSSRTPLNPNNFSTPDPGTCTINGTTFAFQKTIDLLTLNVPFASYGFQNGLQFAKVRFFYNTSVFHKIGLDVDFSGNSPLPSQGIKVDSTGSFAEANRRIEVFQSHPEAPTIFDNVLFSPTSGIVK